MIELRLVSLGRSVLSGALVHACTLAHAAPPDAGSLLQGARVPATQTARPQVAVLTDPQRANAIDRGERIRVSGLRVVGAEALMSKYDISPLLLAGVGKHMSLRDLDEVADRITRFYREKGFLVARAYVPAQDVVDGEVEIAVVEGRLDQVQALNKANVPTWLLSSLGALEIGAPVKTRALKDALQPLQDLPGVEVRSTLRPGATVGGTELLVDVAPGKALTGSADADNFGSAYTGRYRLGLSLFLNNPLSLADQVGMRVQTGGKDFAYGRLSYQLPVASANTRVGLAWSRMRYQLGEELEELQAQGSATVGSVYLSHALVRDADFSATAQLQYDDTSLQDSVDAVGTTVARKLRIGTASISLEANDQWLRGGTTSASLLVAAGHLALDPQTSRIDAATARSEGAFSRVNASLIRRQCLGSDTCLLLSYSAQWARKNLDSSQKMSAGGIFGVQALREGQLSGDSVQLARAELLWQTSASWKLQWFYDVGHVRLNAQPWSDGGKVQSVSGTGLGATYTIRQLMARLVLARNLGDIYSDIQRSRWQMWTQLSGSF